MITGILSYIFPTMPLACVVMTEQDSMFFPSGDRQVSYVIRDDVLQLQVTEKLAENLNLREIAM